MIQIREEGDKYRTNWNSLIQSILFCLFCFVLFLFFFCFFFCIFLMHKITTVKYKSRLKGASTYQLSKILHFMDTLKIYILGITIEGLCPRMDVWWSIFKQKHIWSKLDVTQCKNFCWCLQYFDLKEGQLSPEKAILHY